MFLGISLSHKDDRNQKKKNTQIKQTSDITRISCAFVRFTSHLDVHISNQKINEAIFFFRCCNCLKKRSILFFSNLPNTFCRFVHSNITTITTTTTTPTDDTPAAIIVVFGVLLVSKNK